MTKPLLRTHEHAEPDKIRQQLEMQILQLDKRIEELKYEYQLFFNGERKPNIPPEKEREELEKVVRRISQNESRSPRISMLLQNLISRFNVYNNMWLKKMTDIESGVSPTQRRGKAAAAKGLPGQTPGATLPVNLNDESSFEKIYDAYCRLADKKKEEPDEKEKVINLIKSKLIFSNLIMGSVEMAVNKGKLSLKIRE